MIKLNGQVIEQNHFPDGTLLMKHYEEPYGSYDRIEWFYENDAELFALICLRKHLKNRKVYLYLPYVPHARMDRVKNKEDIFTLKYFCEVINSLNFFEVRILDPHSDVAPALLNNVIVNNPNLAIKYVANSIKTDNLLYYFPDAGAAKRYSSMISAPYTYGNKVRDWETGQIKGLTIADSTLVNGKDILIIDDICSRGGTFYHSAKALKTAGAKNIYLYITHCENTILEGELLTSGLIEKVYTTNSIFTKEHEKIEVIEL